MSDKRLLLSGDEAIAQAALDGGVALGTGYPGTPSTEILEHFDVIGGRAQWAPNEKVAFEVALGAAYGGARAIVTMKHVGLNVAADPLFTATYTGVAGALLVMSADDPGMASSQNEQDNRNYAKAAGIPMLEPSDSQEVYDFTLRGLALSHEYQMPVMLRITTRVCHARTIVRRAENLQPAPAAHFTRDVPGRVMIPAYAKPAHRRLREKLAKLAAWNESCDLNQVVPGGKKLGIIASGISFMHALEAIQSSVLSPQSSGKESHESRVSGCASTESQATFLKLGMTWPLPLDKIKKFAASVERCLVIEEGDPFLVDELRAAGVAVEGKAAMYRFGELNVNRVRRILAGDTSPEAVPARGKPPQLCVGCPHRNVFETLRELGCIVAGDIGCYTLGVLPPFEAMDSCVCMGASIGVGLGLRQVLPAEQARKVVSVIGDSTFVHSGITGLVEMVYNPPPSGHVVLILDNGTTAMTGLQEHPGTGRRLNHEPTNKLNFEELARALGIENVTVTDPLQDQEGFRKLLVAALANGGLNLIITRRPCLLAFKKIKAYEAATPSGKE